jgi:hypothetical protein
MLLCLVALLFSGAGLLQIEGLVAVWPAGRVRRIDEPERAGNDPIVALARLLRLIPVPFDERVRSGLT